MSSFIYENERFISFSNYCLSESIKPKEISYGLNDATDDGEIKKLPSTMMTFFRHGDHTYMVSVMRNGEVGFGVSSSTERHLDNIIKFNTKRTGGGDAVKVFSYVFFVLGKINKQFGLKRLMFNSSDNMLGKMYDNLVKNKFFIKELKTMGYVYKGEIGVYHTFERFYG